KRINFENSSPTAQPSVADTMLTPRRTPERGISGLFTLVQLVPFQCMMSPPPTAHASEADTALTADNSPVMSEAATGVGDDGARAAGVPASTTLPATAEGTSHRPRCRIEPTACALVITDLPISGISGANLNPEAPGIPARPTRMGSPARNV